MNQVIDTICSHRSIRKFKETPLSDTQLEAIITSAKSASTSSNVQAYSVIGVTDSGLKQQLAVLTGNQAYVAQCPLFLVWCADLHRSKMACEQRESTTAYIPTMENFIVSTVDVALAAQNAALAAESMGLGIVYIGGIRNNPGDVAALLRLPELVYPVFGMCVGVPDQVPSIRPRLDAKAVYHHNSYDSEHVAAGIESYDQVMQEYYRGRQKDTTWSNEMADKFSKHARPHMRNFLEQQGFRFD
ncbi:oxygen-insensitive NADPH nitroreductase [Brevibacillus sp. NRS-1366]|uniref:oxygen-insensitive NADPH nitroreductase n=1 Tax=Brevibacillus sp. NRS-1366 TaxID=3233899 RepID=UPI003D1ECD91